MNVETSGVQQSVMSSTSQSSSTISHDSISTIFDNLFPIADHISQIAHLPDFLVSLIQLWLFFQMIVVAFWVPMNPNLSNYQFQSDISYITAAAFCFKKTDSDMCWLIPFLVYAVLFVISLGMLIYQILYYKSHRNFITWTLYPVRFFLELVPLAALHPIAALFGILIYDYDGHDMTKLTAIVFSAIFYIYFAVLMSFSTNFLNCSAYLENHALATFDVDVYRIPIIISSFLIGAQYFVQFFPVWAIYFLIAVHVIFLVVSTAHIMYFPYVSKVSNVLHLSVLMTTAILDILRIVSIFTTFSGGIIQYITAVVIVLSIVGSSLIFYYVTNSYKKKLMYNQICNANDDHGGVEHVTLSDDEKSDRFTSLNLINHRLKTIFYLHLGIEYMCDLFIDFTLIKWIGQSQPQTDVLLDLVKFLILFPGEYRLTNVVVNSSLRRRNLSLSHRNLLFQVIRIKILRQSSSSIQSSQKLAEMRNLNKTCESEILSFYNRSEVTLGLLMHINSLLTHTHSMWEEALKSFPNSSIHREEHIRYLVECETNFDSAIVQAHRKELIETGYNFSVDHCFRCLVRTYPMYLKKKILDMKGHFLKSALRKGSQSQNSNSNNSNQFSFTSTSDMDQKMEEEIGKTILKQSKIRLALQSATQGKRANNSTKLTNFNRVALLISVVIFTVLFAVFFSYFDGRFSATERSLKCNKCRINFDITNFWLLMAWANESSTKRLEFQASDEAKWFENESRDSGILDINENYSKNAIINNVYAHEAYSDFLFDLAALARTGVNIFPMTIQLMQNVVPQKYCFSGQPSSASMINLRSMVVYHMMIQVMLASETTGFDNWFKSNDQFCTVFGTIKAIGKAFTDLRHLLVDEQTKSAQSVKSLLNNLSYIIPSCFIVIMFFPYFVLTLMFNHEIHHFVSLIMSVDTNHKNDAMSPLMKNENDSAEMQNAEEQPPVARHVVVYLILIFVLTCGLMGFLIGFMISVNNMNTKFDYIGIWSYKATSRSPLAVESLISLYFSIFMQSEATNISTSAAELEHGKDMIVQIEGFRDMLLQGDDEAPSVLNFDETLTNLMIQSICTPGGEDVILHDMYVCGSVNQLTIFFKDLFNSASANMKMFNGKINHESTLNLYHITLYHLLPRFSEVDDQLTRLGVNFQKSYKDNIIIIYICALGVSIVLFLVGTAFTNILDGAFNAALVLLRRISPVGIIAKPRLVKYLLEISSEEKDSSMTISKSVFRNSQDGIFCIGLSGTIEVVNPAVSSILGYTPDQMLGQSIANVMDELDAATVRSQLQLMADRQSAPVYESHVVCVTDNDLKIECSLTVLAITETSGEISSFVAVIRDEHELVTQQEEAEKAKAQSENLLFQILPRGIVVRLNQGEKDISFSVPSSTICFVDIVKFSEYTASMKPQEIMGTLSSLFGAFDEILTKYSFLLKIKLIGDTYMCAGGLFSSPDEPTSLHAEQMIRFGLDALQQLEETNIKMNSLLNVRIGVNTGGPLIAGVLGTDKPVFDIIGDPINIASRLQSTDIPGKIQISQTTYDLIKDMDFLIDQRGEVFLKGKGQSMTYLVSPHINTFQLSNVELSDSQTKPGKESLSMLPNLVPLQPEAPPPQ